MLFIYVKKLFLQWKRNSSWDDGLIKIDKINVIVKNKDKIHNGSRVNVFVGERNMILSHSRANAENMVETLYDSRSNIFHCDGI